MIAEKVTIVEEEGGTLDSNTPLEEGRFAVIDEVGGKKVTSIPVGTGVMGIPLEETVDTGVRGIPDN